MNIPENLLYTKTHEWLKKIDDNIAVIGITDFAQKSLGDIVFVDFTAPEGTQLAKGEIMCELESVKAVESSYIPVSGVITEVNSLLEDDYGLVNTSCYESGWLVKIKMDNNDELSELLDSKAYTELCEKEQH